MKEVKHGDARKLVSTELKHITKLVDDMMQLVTKVWLKFFTKPVSRNIKHQNHVFVILSESEDRVVT